MEMPPVDMLPVSASLTISPSSGTESRVWPWPASTSLAASSTLIRVSTFSWPTPRRGSALVRSTSCSTVDVTVADHVGRHPLGDRDHPAVDDQAAVVLAGHERLDDHAAAAGLLLRDREGLADVVLVLQVEAHAAAVVAVERLDHDRVADPAAAGHCLVGRAHRLLLGHRQAGRAEQPGGEVLVGGDVDRDRGGLRGHGGADPLGVDALAELDEGVLVEPDPRDVARDGLVEDRLGRRTERRPLGAQDEALELGLPVELRVGLDEVVDQPDGEPAGGEADVLVDVAVDDVVDARLALDLAGLAAPDVVTDDLLEGERAVLGDVAEPGALVEPLDEAAAAAARARVVARGRAASASRCSVKPGSVLVGNCSSEPRSTTRWIDWS